MGPAEVIAIVLAGLLVFQQIHWSRQTQRLVDKLMSKNYAEYVQAENLKAPARPAVVDQDAELKAIAEERSILDELNGAIHI